MKTSAKLLFTAIAAVLAAVGTLAIVTEVHIFSTRRQGIVTLFGEDAVRSGQTWLLLAVLPLLVWVPLRWFIWAGAVWGIVLMAWVFGPMVLR